MEELQRIREITRQYPELQGLRMVPFGLFIIFIGLQRMNLPFLGRQGDLTYSLPILILVFFLWFLIGRYYERTFGKVEPLAKRKSQLRLELFWLVGMVLIVFIENVLYRIGIDLPFSLIEAYVGLSLLRAGIKMQRWYYKLTGILTLAMSLLPAITHTGLGDLWFGSMGIIFSLGFGILISLVGLLDHLKLIRSLHGVNGGTHARAEG